MTVNALQRDLKKNGVGQGDLVTLVQNLVDTVNELVDDHATYKTVVDDIKTATNAIITAASSDSATNIAAVTPVATSSPATLSDTTDLTLSAS